MHLQEKPNNCRVFRMCTSSGLSSILVSALSRRRFSPEKGVSFSVYLRNSLTRGWCVNAFVAQGLTTCLHLLQLDYSRERIPITGEKALSESTFGTSCPTENSEIAGQPRQGFALLIEALLFRNCLACQCVEVRGCGIHGFAATASTMF